MIKIKKVFGLLAASFLVVACQSSNVSFKAGFLGKPNPDGIDISAILFKPDGKGPFPAVVLLHTCGGLKQHVTDDWPDFLTGHGYVVLTVDSYSPRGADNCREWVGRGWLLPQARDAFGALNYLANLPFVDGNRVGVMGFSTGAVVINEIIWRFRREGERNFKAAISLYGACLSLNGYSKDDMPLMQIAAELDEKAAPGCVDAGESSPMEVHLLKNAYHGFDDLEFTSIRHENTNQPYLYSGSATDKARELTKIFFAKHLGK